MKPGRPKLKKSERKRHRLVICLDDATLSALRKAGKPSTKARQAVEDRYRSDH